FGYCWLVRTGLRRQLVQQIPRRARTVALATVVTLLAAGAVVGLALRQPVSASPQTNGTTVGSAATGSDVPGGATAERPGISADGRFVAFTTLTSFDPEDVDSSSDTFRDIYVRDTVARTTT